MDRIDELASRNRNSKGTRFAARLLAGAVLVVGALLIFGGLWLAVLGGSLYYVIVGAAYCVSAVLLWRGRSGGALLIVLVFVGTLFWALAEVGLRFWPLLPRLLIPAIFAAIALTILPYLDRPLSRVRRNTSFALAGGATLMVVALLGLMFVTHDVISPPDGTPFAKVAGDNHPADWSSYGRTTAGTRFAPFDQINRGNVDQLKVAWTFRTGEKGEGSDQNTPLQIGDTVYTCSRSDQIDALDADTGKLRWRFALGAKAPQWQRCRGLGFYDTHAAPQTACAKRIFNTTIDARLIALDAVTGKPCAGFGVNGSVDLTVGMGEIKPGYYFPTSAPLVARDRIIVGGWVKDNEERHEPSGVIRAFDANSGSLVWVWDLANPSNKGLPLPGQTYTRGTPNMWSTASFDDKLGLVYLPLGNEGPDYYGVGRLPSSERYSSALVALDVTTGQERWKFKTVHHDIWDFDLPSQPALIDLPDKRGGTIPAILQTTKTGQLFLLNRATGIPISRVEERAVPQRGQVPEERLSPTQPYSIDMPTIGSIRLTEKRMWGMTMLDQLYCRISYHRTRYEGDFTPIGRDWTFNHPGNLGGMNWGSVAYDPVNQYAYVVDGRLAYYFKLDLQSQFAANVEKYPKGAHGLGPGRMGGTPYSLLTFPFMSPLKVPCSEPPFGTITAIDLKSRKVAWQVPSGTAERSGPFGFASHLPMPIGMPSYAGTSATAGGLVFFAGFQDFNIRAYDAATGKVVWRHPLPVGSSATPMTYVSPRTGRQFVLVSAGGAAQSDKTGDYIMAFALPKSGGPAGSARAMKP